MRVGICIGATIGALTSLGLDALAGSPLNLSLVAGWIGATWMLFAVHRWAA